jgi:hypothetical protein
MAVREDNIKVDFKETGYKIVNWINLAWDRSWHRVLAKMTMATLVTMNCLVKTDRLLIGAHEQNINELLFMPNILPLFLSGKSATNTFVSRHGECLSFKAFRHSNA